MDIQLTITSVASVLLSLLFSFFPSVSDWYSEKTKDEKQLIMIGLLFLATVLIYGVSFLGIGTYFGLPNLSFDAEHVVSAFMAFIQAIVVNAGTYKSTNYIVEKAEEKRRGVG